MQTDYSNQSKTVWYGSLRIGLWQWCTSPAFSSLPPATHEGNQDDTYYCQSYSSSDVDFFFSSQSATFNACRALVLLSSFFIAVTLLFHVLRLLRRYQPHRCLLFGLSILCYLPVLICLLLVRPLTDSFQFALDDLFSLYCPPRLHRVDGCWREGAITDWARAAILAVGTASVPVMMLHWQCCMCYKRLQRQVQLEAFADSRRSRYGGSGSSGSSGSSSVIPFRPTVWFNSTPHDIAPPPQVAHPRSVPSAYVPLA